MTRTPGPTFVPKELTTEGLRTKVGARKAHAEGRTPGPTFVPKELTTEASPTKVEARTAGARNEGRAS